MRKFSAILLFTASAAFLPAAYAEDTTTTTGDDLDGVEMDVMDSDDTAVQASAKIVLPEGASDVAREHSERGLQTANDAREGGADYGHSVAEQSRDAASDRGRETADSARDSHPTGRP